MRGAAMCSSPFDPHFSVLLPIFKDTQVCVDAPAYFHMGVSEICSKERNNRRL